MSNDPGCKGQTQSEQVMVNDGHLANVLVYVKSGLPDASYPAPKEAVDIKQEGCRTVGTREMGESIVKALDQAG